MSAWYCGTIARAPPHYEALGDVGEREQRKQHSGTSQEECTDKGNKTNIVLSVRVYIFSALEAGGEYSKTTGHLPKLPGGLTNSLQRALNNVIPFVCFVVCLVW